MNIFDSYVRAGQELDKAAKAEFYTALIEYIAYDVEPEFKKVAAKAVFVAIRPSLDISKQRSKSGAAGGSKKQANKDFASSLLASKTPSKSEANALANSNSNSISEEKEKEKESRSHVAALPLRCRECGGKVEKSKSSGNYVCTYCHSFAAPNELYKLCEFTSSAATSAGEVDSNEERWCL